MTHLLERWGYTWGSETSQYPEEKKPTRSSSFTGSSSDLVNDEVHGIPVVAASEVGEAQTWPHHTVCDAVVYGGWYVEYSRFTPAKLT